MLELRSVSVVQGGFSLGPLSHQFGDGVTGVIGPNGSGKSTLCRAVAGIIRPNAGDVLYDGNPLKSLSPVERAASIAFVPQELPPGEGFSLLEFTAMGYYRFSRDYSGHGKKYAFAALQTVDLAERADQAYSSLSGGEKRRAVLARALVQDASTLILDEPGSFLDYAHSRVMVSVIRDLIQGTGKRVIIVSHDCVFLRAVCDQVIGLQAGKVIRSGDASLLLQSAEFLSAIYGIRFDDSNGVLLPDFYQ